MHGLHDFNSVAHHAVSENKARCIVQLQGSTVYAQCIRHGISLLSPLTCRALFEFAPPPTPPPPPLPPPLLPAMKEALLVLLQGCMGMPALRLAHLRQPV